MKNATFPPAGWNLASSSPATAPTVNGSADTDASRGVPGASVITQTTGISFLAALRMYAFKAAGLPGAMINPLVPSRRASSKSGMSPSPRLGIAPEIHVQRRGEGRRRLTDALAERVPEERDLSRQVDGNAKLFARLQVAGREVRAIAERFGHAQDARPGHRVHARLGVKRAIDGAGGNLQGARDVLDPDRMRRRRGLSSVRGHALANLI